MYLKKIIKGYNTYYGFLSTLYNSIYVNKYIGIFLLGVLGFPIWFSISLYNIDNIGIVISSVAFAICTFTAAILVRYEVKKSFGSTDNYSKERLKEFSKVIFNDLECTKIQQIQYLEEMIDNEIRLLDETKKYPFASTIKTLTTGVLITGLLSFSLNALKDGNPELAIPLLTIYLFIIGLIIIFSSVLYNAKEYTKKYKFLHIRVLLSEIKINMVKDAND